MRAITIREKGVGLLGWMLGCACLAGVQGATAQGNSPTVTVAITSPASGTVVTAPGNLQLTATASINRQNWVILRVEFYSGAELIGTAMSAPYTFQWTNLPAGSYTLTAKAIATNPSQTKQSPATHPNMPTWEGTSTPITVIVNAPPTVTLTAPALNALFTAPANFTVTASANDIDGTVTQVDFYQGGALVGSATSAPYSVALSNLVAGNYSFTAVATDNRGATATSSPVPIVLNAPPTVSLTSPAPGAVFTAPATINLAATAADTDGSITQVEFFQGATLLATVTTAPYTTTLNNVAAGSFSFTVRATDNRGATTTSTAVAVTVNAPPTVSLTAPTNNATFTAPADITLTAQVADTDGTISHVEYLEGATLIATRTTAPYSIIWTGVPAGSYSLTARATDNLGASVTSVAVNVTVNTGVAQLYFIHPDHLNTPRVITNSTGQAVWRWDHAEPFGSNPPNENPSGLGTFTCNLRLPGQYFDKETNLHYNYFRDYDPSIGRYVESDPIGLTGGLNTYSYVSGSPLKHSDVLGLKRSCGTGRTEPLTPDFFPNCCGEHDDCYDDCIRLPSKGTCDDAFRDCALKTCNSRWAPVRFACMYAALYYYGGLVVLGGPVFNDARSKCNSSQCKR